MELITCLAFAVSAFILIIASIVGLVSAPTPILLVILLGGMLLTQKSINKLAEFGVNSMEERNRNTVEKVEIASKDTVNQDHRENTKSMTYRGFNYNRIVKSEKTPNYKPGRLTHYRGAVIDNSKKEIV
jgi:hypothetical protein